MADAIDRAIAAAEDTVPAFTVQIRSDSGRVFPFLFPADITDAELLDIVGELAKGGSNSLRAAIRERRAVSGPRLLVPA